MACVNELPTLVRTLVLLDTNETLDFEGTWYPVAGVGSVDLTADVRNVVLGANATIAIKPAIQFASVRVDRPGAGAAIAAGSVITGAGATHFEENITDTGQFWFRIGWSYKLTAGSYARCETRLYTAFGDCAKQFPAREIVFNPLNDTNVVSYFPIIPPFAAVRADKVKAAVVLMDNLNNKLEWKLWGRGFNDPQARGAWQELGTIDSWFNPAAGDSALNTGELALATPLSLGGNHWAEIALAVRKQLSGDANSRCIFRVLPAIKYT